MAAEEAVSVLDAMRAEFCVKGDLLGGEDAQVSPEEYYRAIFREKYDERRVAGWTKQAAGKPKAKNAHKGKGCIRRFNGCAEMVRRSHGRSDAYTFLADFFNDYPKTELLRKVYGLVVDLDGISVPDVELLLQTQFFLLRPTYVVNSGHGLHLVYVFDKPVDAYRWAVYELDIVYRLLKEHFIEAGTDYHVDNVGLVHMFRIIGSRTKIGCTCTAYRAGGLWPVAELAEHLGYHWADRSGMEPRRPSTGPKGGAKTKWKPNGYRAFYVKTKSRIIKETPVGNRYMSMLALATVGYKCHVHAEDVEKDLRYLQGVFNGRKDAPAIRDAEIGKAMAGYNDKAMTVKRETLNGWLGFNFEPQKRNGRSQAEHLERNRQLIHDTKIRYIRLYLQSHPNASSSEISRNTPVSRQTVVRYRGEVEADLAAERLAAMQADEQTNEQVTVADSADINRLFIRIMSTSNPDRRERLIRCLPLPYQDRVRRLISSA